MGCETPPVSSHQRYFEDREGWKFTTRQVGPPEGFEYYQYVLEYDG